jgi:hypothetical protein
VAPPTSGLDWADSTVLEETLTLIRHPIHPSPLTPHLQPLNLTPNPNP